MNDRILKFKLVGFIARKSATEFINSPAHYYTNMVEYKHNNSVDVINIDQLEYAEQVRGRLLTQNKDVIRQHVVDNMTRNYNNGFSNDECTFLVYKSCRDEVDEVSRSFS